MKHVLITGASTGIGYDASKYLVNNGFYVIGTVRKTADVERLKKEIPNKNFEVMLLDLNSDESINACIVQLNEKLKKSGLYGLINNAGIAICGPLFHIPFKDFYHQIDTNLFSAFKLTNGLIELLGAGFKNPLPPGRIINITSISGLINSPLFGPYSISKHALESMSDIYRRELAIYDIKTIIIEPGPIKTPIWRKSIPTCNPVKGTDFENAFEVFIKRILKTEKNALPVEKVTEAIYKALTRKKPKSRYLIIRNKLKMKLIIYVFSSKWRDRKLIRNYKRTLVKR
jgi:short-subunit dehydrogenase